MDSSSSDWRYDVLYAISRALGAKTNVSKKLQQVIETLADLTQFDHAEAFLLDKEHQHVDVLAAVNCDSPSLVGRRIALELSAIAQLVLQKQHVTPITLPPDFVRLAGDEKLLPEKIETIVCIPLVGQSGSIGGILLMTQAPDIGTLYPQMIDVIGAVASQTAIFIEDMLLSAAAKRMAEQMRLVNEISREMAALHDLEAILSIIPDRLTEMFGYYHVSVGLVTPQGIEMYEAAQHSRAVGAERFRISPDMPGIIPWVVRQSKSYCCNDTRQDDIWVAGKGLEASRSELTVPLIYHDCIIGIIDVQSEHVNAFDHDDISILEALASQLAVSVENARLYSENMRQRQTAEALSHVSRLVSSMLDLHSVSETVLIECNKLVPFDIGFIALLEDDKLRLAHQQGCSVNLLPLISRLAEESSLMYQILRFQEAILILDTHEHRLWQKMPRALPIRSWLGVPLVSRGHPIGVLAAASSVPGTYSQSDCDLLLAFANQVAVTIDNAQLFERIDWREREARTLYEITRLLVSLDQEAIPISVMNKLADAIPFDIGGMMVSGDPPRLVVVAKRSVSEALIKTHEERLLNAYNALSQEQISRRSVQRRLIFTGSSSDSIYDVISRLSAPLLMGRRVAGVIELGSADPGTYAEPELRTLMIVANATATALENAGLYQELSDRAIHLQHALDELAETVRMKDELAQNISHELRNPLTYITSYSDLLLAEELGNVTGDQAASLKIIRSKSRALLRLVDDILAVNKTAVEVPLVSSVNLQHLIEQAVRAIRVVSDEAGIRISTEIEASVGPVMADSDRIAQVLDNLLTNAVKFSSSGDTITIRLLSPSAERVRIEIEDTGIGIPAGKLPHIFERYYQVESIPRRSNGVGLGLAICKQIIEAHQGQIGVQSTEGAGSLFFFELPKAGPQLI